MTETGARFEIAQSPSEELRERCARVRMRAWCASLRADGARFMACDALLALDRLGSQLRLRGAARRPPPAVRVRSVELDGVPPRRLLLELETADGGQLALGLTPAAAAQLEQALLRIPLPRAEAGWNGSPPGLRAALTMRRG